MKSYIKLYTSTFGILVDLESTGEEKWITEKKNITVFRVCQEALTNIAKYADTSNIKINIVWQEDVLTITIQDFGKGFKLEPNEVHHSSGLAAMKERMLLTGGHCTISSRIGEGTSIELSLPL
jgi:two-component system sensor histidine kinase NreB